MKFQNCIFINFVTDARTEGRTDKPKEICSFNFSKDGSIIKLNTRAKEIQQVNTGGPDNSQ